MTIKWFKSKDRKLRIFMFEWAWYRAYRVLEKRSGIIGHLAGGTLSWHQAQHRAKRLRQVITRRQQHLQRSAYSTEALMELSLEKERKP